MSAKIIELHPAAPSLAESIGRADVIQDLRHIRSLLRGTVSSTYGAADLFKCHDHLIMAVREIEAAVASINTE